ncbi:HNH endonuclease [Comamonas odontotermitis]|uniref:HNH endonuclease n=1 Tax=Comamonas odontotermitis TaxID=379895 RepID=UPI00366F8119
MALNKAQRAALREKFGGRCAYCGLPLGERWHADHIEAIDRQWWKPGSPAAKPELDTLENMNPSCPPCNIDKHSMSLESWRSVMQRSNEVLMRDVSTFRRAVRYGLVQLNNSPVTFYFERLAEPAPKEAP